jgi:hypothetical protein
MRLQNKGGDVLASGGVRCQFLAAGAKVSQEVWDRIWSENEPETNSSNSDVQTDGDAGASAGEAAAVSGS